VRDLSELTAVEDPAWPHLAEMIAGSPVDVQVLPADPAEWVASGSQALGPWAGHCPSAWFRCAAI
jgi:hypothetical protein